MCPMSSVTHPSRLHLFNVSLMFEPFMDCDFHKAERIASFHYGERQVLGKSKDWSTVT